MPEAPDAGSGAKPKRPKPSKPGDVAPPMPGRVVKVLVMVKAVVKAGDPLLIIEAMKMENILTAAQDGTVAEVMAAKGESLAVDQPILRFA